MSDAETVTVTMTKKQAEELLYMLDATETDDVVGGVVVGNRIRRAIGQEERLPHEQFRAYMAGKIPFPGSNFYLDKEFWVPESAWTEQ